MDPPSRSGSPCGSPSRVSDNTMEALKEFLQHMTRTVEILCNRYNKLLKSSVSENPDVQTALSIGIPSDSLSVLPIIGQSPETHLCVEMSALQPASNIGEGNFGKVQYWPSQGRSVTDEMQGGRSGTFEEKRVNAAIFEKEAVMLGKPLDANSKGHSFDSKIEDALKAFLEDMKKTVESWSVRHNFLVQGKSTPTREGADLVDAVETTRTTDAIGLQPHPSDSNVRDVDLLDLGSDDVSFPCDKDQDHAPIDLSGEHNQRSDHVSQGCFAKTKVACFPQAEQGPTDAVTLPSPKLGKETACEPPQQSQEAPTQDVADVQDQVKEVKMGFQSVSPMHLEVESVHRKSREDNGEMDVEVTPRNGSGEVDDSATPKVGQAEQQNRTRDLIPKNLLPEMAIPPNDNNTAREVAIQPYCRRVDVVDSPDWLPKGWITELKTRGNGQSAGSKDKYFYDPVSKRRFRSKKEVFCFLETGKLGRYKRRPKISSVEKLLGQELPSVGQANESCQPRNANCSEVSGMASRSTSEQNTLSTSGPSTIASATAPMGLFSNLFMPYRPGQPSEWLVYESLASLPLPVFDHFRYTEYNLSKSMGNRGPASHPWFSSNSEFSWRPFIDRSDLGQSVKKSKDGQIFEFPEGDRPTHESVPRKSATAANKSFLKIAT